MESILTLPINIINIITNLLAALKFAVIPILKPTVLYAEKHSKAMLFKSFSLSKIDIARIAEPITNNDNEITAKARLTEMSEISLLYTSILVFPLAKLQKLRVAMAKVLVFIPPPVEAGEAPIHIKRKIIMMVEKFKAVISTVLNPAVLGVVAPNNAVTTLPKPVCAASVLLYSLI